MSDLHALYTRLEAKVERLQERLEASHLVLTSIEEAILYLNPMGFIILCNPAMERLLNLSDLVDTLFWDHFDDSYFGFSMRDALDSHKRQCLFVELDGREVEISTSYAHGLILLCRDRTEIRKLEAAVGQSNRLKVLGEMAATLAHEIRNPLGGIEGFASLLAQDLKEESHASMVGSILEGTRTLNELVSNVLDYTRNVQLHFTECDLLTLCEELIPYAPELKVSGSSSICAVDRQKLKMALLNLVKNGIEAAGAVSITVLKGGIIEVHDNGPGIAPDLRDKIFTPFFTTKSRGTGLGLVEAKKVIDAHGGKLSVESNSGTTMRVELCR
ncbi:MAG: hypothetical protein K0U13_02355 [Chlamydiae bacterium]|nr:Signal transduction histidine-protein kinase AtoS [Chlamydiales bacterium]MCH9703612.1 hypothetical protein [Chlamydiota bacterium]